MPETGTMAIDDMVAKIRDDVLKRRQAEQPAPEAEVAASPAAEIVADSIRQRILASRTPRVSIRAEAEKSGVFPKRSIGATRTWTEYPKQPLQPEGRPQRIEYERGELARNYVPPENAGAFGVFQEQMRMPIEAAASGALRAVGGLVKEASAQTETPPTFKTALMRSMVNPLTATPAISNFFWSKVMDKKLPNDWVAKNLGTLAQWFERKGEEVAPVEATWRDPASKIVQIAASNGPMLAAAAATKNPYFGAALFGITGSGETRMAAEQAGVTPEKEEIAALLSGAVNAAFGMVPQRWWSKDLANATAERFLKEGAEVGLVNLLMTVGNNAVAKYGYDDGRKLLEGFWDNLVLLGGFRAAGITKDIARKSRVDAAVKARMSQQQIDDANARHVAAIAERLRKANTAAEEAEKIAGVQERMVFGEETEVPVAARRRTTTQPQEPGTIPSNYRQQVDEAIRRSSEAAEDMAVRMRDERLAAQPPRQPPSLEGEVELQPAGPSAAEAERASAMVEARNRAEANIERNYAMAEALRIERERARQTAMRERQKPVVEEGPAFADPNTPEALQYLADQLGMDAGQVAKMRKSERARLLSDPQALQQRSAQALAERLRQEEQVARQAADDAIKAMKSAEVDAALSSRGESTKGVPAAKKVRLKKAIAKEVKARTEPAPAPPVEQPEAPAAKPPEPVATPVAATEPPVRETQPALRPTGEQQAKPVAVPATAIEALTTAKRNPPIVVPEGTTFLRVTDAQGRQSTVALAEVQKGENVLAGADIASVEPGTKTAKGEFKPMEGEVTVKPPEAIQAEAKSATDRAIARLQKAKIKTKGRVYSAELGIPIAMYNAAIDVTIAAIKAGRTFAESVDAAVKYLRDKSVKFDENRLRAALNRNLEAASGVEERNLAIPSTQEPVRRVMAEAQIAQGIRGEPVRRPWEPLRQEAQKVVAERGASTIISEAAEGKVDTSDQGTFIMKEAMSSPDAVRMATSGDPAQIKTLTDAYDNYAKGGTPIAQALAARQDPAMNTPDGRRAWLLQEVLRLGTTRKGREKVPTEPADKERRIRIVKEAMSDLKRQGIDIGSISVDDLMDRRTFGRIMREVGFARFRAGVKVRGFSGRAEWAAHMAYELWRNGILSFIRTHEVNLLGTAGAAAWENTIQRSIEDAIGRTIGATETPSARAASIAARAASQSMSEAMRNAVESFASEMPIHGDVKWEDKGVAIPGRIGRAIRTPQRALMMEDEFMHTILQNAYAADYAYRRGEAQGKTGVALERYVAEQIADKASEANERAMAKTLEQLWKDEPGDFANRLMQARRGDSTLAWTLKFLFPFVKTPARIISFGVRKSPLGSVRLASRAISSAGQEGPYRGVEGRRKLAYDLAEQGLAWGALAGLMALTKEDENGLPFITGSRYQGRNATRSQVEQEITPPMSIRIGKDENGRPRWLDYSRIEPFATTMGLIVDTLNAAKTAKKEGIMAGVGAEWDAVKGLVREKAFLQQLSDIMQIWEAGSAGGNRLLKIVENWAASWNPNIIRATVRELEPKVRMQPKFTKAEPALGQLGRHIAQRAFPAGEGQPPAKMDIWGNEITKEVLDTPASDFLFRLLSPMRVQKTDVNNWDLTLWNWNRTRTDDADRWYPSQINDKQKNARGEDVYLTQEDAAAIYKRRGQLALKLLTGSGVPQPDLNKVTEADIKRMQTAFRKAQEAAIMEYRRNTK